MSRKNDVKQQIMDHVRNVVAQRLDTFKSAADAAKDSKQNETKSSAGDKYETGRAMMQIEQEKNEAQWQQAWHLKQVLDQIDIHSDYDKAMQGSLVITNQGVYFLSIGIGKVLLNQVTYFCISVNSPIGQLLLGKSVGDKIIFKESEINVLEIE